MKRFYMLVALVFVAFTLEARQFELKNVYRSIVHSYTNASKGPNIAVSGDNIAVLFSGQYGDTSVFNPWTRLAYSQDDGQSWRYDPANIGPTHDASQWKTQRLYLDAQANPRFFVSSRHNTVGDWFRLYYSNNKGTNWAYVTYPFHTNTMMTTAATGVLFPDGKAGGFCIFTNVAVRLYYCEFPTNSAGGYDPPVSFQTLPVWDTLPSGVHGRYAVIDPLTGRPRCFYSTTSACYLGGMTNDSTKTFELFNMGLTYEGSGPAVAVDESGRYYMSHHRNYGGTSRSSVYLAEFEYGENGAIQNLTETLVHEDDGALMASDAVVGLGSGGSVIVGYLWSTNAMNGVPSTGQHGPCDVLLKVRDGAGKWYGPFVVASGDPLGDPAPEYPGAGHNYCSSYGRGGEAQSNFTMTTRIDGNKTFIYLVYGEYANASALSNNSPWTGNLIVRKLELKIPQGTIIIMQ